jgi:hypothetical protein
MTPKTNVRIWEVVGLWIITQYLVNPSGMLFAPTDLHSRLSPDVCGRAACDRSGSCFQDPGGAVRTAKLGGHDTHTSVTSHEVLV